MGLGLTCIVKDRGVPVHPNPPLVNLGVAVMVAVTGTGVVLIALKENIVPEPLAANPIEGVLFVHV